MESSKKRALIYPANDFKDDPYVRDVVETVFFASLCTEEGDFAAIQVAFMPDGIAGLQKATTKISTKSGSTAVPIWEVMRLSAAGTENRLGVEQLVKLSPVTSQGETHIVVGINSEGALEIEGLAILINREEDPEMDTTGVLIVSADAPGCMTASSRDFVLRRYERGRRIKRIGLFELLLDKESRVHQAIVRLCDGILNRFQDWSFWQGDPERIVIDPMIDLIKKSAKIGRGGLILMSGNPPEANGKYLFEGSACNSLSEAIVRDATARKALFDLVRKGADGDEVEAGGGDEDHANFYRAASRFESKDQRNTLDHVVSTLANLTAMDNALLIGRDLTMVAAGFVVSDQWSGRAEIGEACNPKATDLRSFPIARFGSRHKAAAAFANRGVGNLAILVSADGSTRFFLGSGDRPAVVVWEFEANR